VLGDLHVLAWQLHLGEYIAKAVFGDLVDEQPNRAIFTMLAKERYATCKRRFRDGRHRDEKLAGESVGDTHGCIVAAAGSGRAELFIAGRVPCAPVHMEAIHAEDDVC
jgi:hypothetical protein